MVVIGSTDFVGHWFWDEKDKVEEIYRSVDRMVGKIIERPEMRT